MKAADKSFTDLQQERTDRAVVTLGTDGVVTLTDNSRGTSGQFRLGPNGQIEILQWIDSGKA